MNPSYSSMVANRIKSSPAQFAVVRLVAEAAVMQGVRPRLYGWESDSSVSPHPWLTECVECADALCALEERVPILRLRPRLEVVEGDVGKLTAERCAIDRVADTVEPFVHLGGVLTHALADDVQRDLEIGERATGDTREDGDDVVARELVASRGRSACPRSGRGPRGRERRRRRCPRRRLARAVSSAGAASRRCPSRAALCRSRGSP